MSTEYKRQGLLSLRLKEPTKGPLTSAQTATLDRPAPFRLTLAANSLWPLRDRIDANDTGAYPRIMQTAVLGMRLGEEPVI